MGQPDVRSPQNRVLQNIWKTKYLTNIEFGYTFKIRTREPVKENEVILWKIRNSQVL